MTTLHNGLPVEITQQTDIPWEHITYVLDSRIFKSWLDSVDSQFIIRSLEISAVDFRGAASVANVLFVRLRVFLSAVPFAQVVELRGDTVVMLPILHLGGSSFTIVVNQARLPTGDVAFAELPAGMIDDNTFKGAAARELEEELGLVFREDQLTELTSHPLYTSSGLLDEKFRLFLVEFEVTVEEFDNLVGKTTGVHEEGESITLSVIPVSDLWSLRCSKAITALALYSKYRHNIS